MQRRRVADRREIRRAVGAGTYLVERGEISDTAHAGDAARMGNGGADIVDQLLFNELLTVPDAVKDLTYRDGGYGVLAN